LIFADILLLSFNQVRTFSSLSFEEKYLTTLKDFDNGVSHGFQTKIYNFCMLLIIFKYHAKKKRVKIQ